MMTSKEEIQKRLCSLLFTTTSHYEDNLQTLLSLIQKTAKNSIVLAHEVALTGFDYDNLEEALAFAEVAQKELKKASKERTVVLTMLEKREGVVFNVAKVFHKGKLVYERAKARLFRLGNEHKYMSEGSDNEFEIFEIDGIKVALFICFELRFKVLWQKAEGADLILVPSWWGKPREEHFKILTQALALMNECYVVVSDARNEECTALSAIITPQGKTLYNGNTACLEVQYNDKEIQSMRRYINIGIK